MRHGESLGEGTMHTPGSRLHFGGWRLRQARVRLLRAAMDSVIGPACGRCGSWIDPTLSGLHPDGATVGHILPVSAGGDDSFDNLQLEHRRCNLAAAARVAPPAATVVEPIAWCEPCGYAHVFDDSDCVIRSVRSIFSQEPHA